MDNTSTDIGRNRRTSQWDANAGQVKQRHLVSGVRGTSNQYLSPGSNTEVVWRDMDGWVVDYRRWTATGLYTFTVPGDATTFFYNGNYVHWSEIDNPGDYYGIIQQVSFNGKITTITLVTQDAFMFDASIFNNAYGITDNWISQAQNPFQWHGEFNYSSFPTFTSGGGAFTNNPDINACKFFIWTTRVFLTLNFSYNATSGGSGATLVANLPLAANLSESYTAGSGIDVTNGHALSVVMNGSTAKLEIRNYDGNTTIANSHNIIVNINYIIEYPV